MSNELTEALFNKYPLIFKGRYKSIQESLIPFGIECGNGWYWLIGNLCSQLQWDIDNNNKSYVIKNKFLRKLFPKLEKFINYKIFRVYHFDRYLRKIIQRYRLKQEFIPIETNRYPQIEAVQVKEKFGGLRFYVQSASNEQHAIISWAESLSYNICERCGSTKNIGTTQGWITTLCKECAKDNKTWKENETN